MPSSPKSSGLLGRAPRKTTWNEKTAVSVAERVGDGPSILDENDPNFDPQEALLSSSIDEGLFTDCFFDDRQPAELKHSGSGTTPMTSSSSISTSPATSPLVPGSAALGGDAQVTMNRIADSFLESGDFEGAVVSVEDDLVNFSVYDDFVYRLIRKSLDRSKFERSNVSRLLGLLNERGVLTNTQITRGFEKLILCWEDTKLDVPSAPDMIFTFISNAINDGIVPKNFISRLPEGLLRTMIDDHHQNKRDNVSDEEEEEEEHHLEVLQCYKQKCKNVLEDFFASQGGESTTEVSLMLKNLGHDDMLHEFVRLTLIVSFDKTSEDRHRAMDLVRELSVQGVLSSDDVSWGFYRLIGSIDDIKLDCPNAVRFCAKFIAEGIKNELLPPSFIQIMRRLRLGGSSANELSEITSEIVATMSAHKKKLNKKVSMIENVEDLGCWKKELQNSISEYFNSHDDFEFVRIMRAWAIDNKSSRRSEIVRKLIVASADNKERADRVVELVKSMVEGGVVNEEDVHDGLKHIKNNMNDLKLDVPDISDLVNKFVHDFKARNILTHE